MKVLPFPLSLIEGDTLGKTIYNAMVALVIVAALAWFGWTATKAKFWEWRFERADNRAHVAEANAKTATANAKSADAGAANATETRGNMDAGTVTVRIITEQAAGRLEHASNSVANDGAVSADIVRELQAAHDRAGAAADRLQRTRKP